MAATMRKTLHDVLTQPVLRELAGSAVYERGKVYQQDGHVFDLSLEYGEVRARVAGKSFPDYEVMLWADDDMLDFSCTCPMGEEEDTCKHVVAVGLAWLADAGAERRRAGNGKEPKNGKGRKQAGNKPATVSGTTASLHAFLARQSKEQLCELLLAQAAASQSFHDELMTCVLFATNTLDVDRRHCRTCGAARVRPVPESRRLVRLLQRFCTRAERLVLREPYAGRS
jgi:uncharacterized Zn finger protein